MWHDGQKFQLALWRPRIILLLIAFFIGIVVFFKTGKPMLFGVSLALILSVIFIWIVQAILLRLYVALISKRTKQNNNNIRTSGLS